MFEEIEERKARLDDHRPLAPDMVKKIRESLDPFLIYNNNAIEGNTMTFIETQYYLETGLAVGGKTMDEHREIDNHVRALEYLNSLVTGEFRLNEKTIREVHKILTEGLIDKDYYPGEYKRRDNWVIEEDGTRFNYTPHNHVPAEMEVLLRHPGSYYIKELKMHPVEVATWFHYKFILIHPFQDGNGRVVRLIMNLMLLRAGYVPAVIRAKNKPDYLNALKAVDNSVPPEDRTPGNNSFDISHLLDFIEREMLNTFDLQLGIIESLQPSPANIA